MSINKKRHIILCNAEDPERAEEREFESILDALFQENVLEVSKATMSLVRLRENCDAYYSIYLNKSQLLSLADEFRDLAEEL